MYQVGLIFLLLLGFGSCLPNHQQHDSTFDLTREAKSKESEFDRELDELVEKVDKMSEMLERIYNSRLDEKVEKISETLEKLSNKSENSHPSCSSLLNAGNAKSGVYTIKPPGLGPMEVYCDMTTLGGGWTVIQKRTSDQVDFYRTWEEYRDFFGDIDGNYWLGLEAIHRLTKDRHVELYVKMEDFDKDWHYARYSHFDIESEVSNYRLNVRGYTGNAGDELAWLNGMSFTTKDRDNDKDPHGNCAVDRKGAWWYNVCSNSNLNGLYNNVRTVDITTNYWWRITKKNESLKSSVMMIRPANF